MVFGKQCHDRGIRVISPKRPPGFVKFMSDVDGAVDKYALHFNGNVERTKKTYNYLVPERSERKIEFRRFMFG